LGSMHISGGIGEKGVGILSFSPCIVAWAVARVLFDDKALIAPRSNESLLTHLVEEGLPMVC